MIRRPFLIDFEERRADVRRYMSALVIAERTMKGASFSRHEAELRMFKAGGMLVLYNAVEASARNGIEAIYDEMMLHEVPFDDLRDTIKRRIVQDFKTNFKSAEGHNISSVAKEIVGKSFDAEGIFSGNVDARKIREKATEYGFSTVSDYRLTLHGADLVTVKRNRNDLAHGLVSFGEVGRDYIATDLYRLSRRVMNYMEAVLSQIDTYLDNGDYIA